MTTYTAVTTLGSSDWNDPGTWTQNLGYPGAGDTAVLADDPSGGAYVVNINQGQTFTVAGLELNGNATTFAQTYLLINANDSALSAALEITGALGIQGSSADAGGANTYINLQFGAELIDDSGVGSANVTLSLTDDGTAGNVVVLGSATSGPITNFLNPFEGFALGDEIVLKNAVFDGKFSDYSLSPSSGLTALTVKQGMTILASGINMTQNAALTTGQFYALSDYSIGGTEYLAIVVACFQAGTHLLTDRGEVAVENLREGDLMVTFSGRGETLKPITWIGQRRIDLVSHDNPEIARPVRIRAGAFGEAIPHRDLLLSPDHAVYVDGVLIPAKHLINGTTITQDAGIEEAHYFHIEVDEHDVLLAEGLTVESYLDTGNRDVFADVAPLNAPGFADAISA